DAHRPLHDLACGGFCQQISGSVHTGSCYAWKCWQLYAIFSALLKIGAATSRSDHTSAAKDKKNARPKAWRYAQQ
ncbi:MAG: hypothetical protein ACTH6H_18095, partial [Serratia sp. (in: enterobacteria)]